MDIITTLISFLVSVLDGAHSPEILDTHPRDLFPATRAYKRARKAINQRLSALGLDTIGEQPTVSAWAHALVLIGIHDDLDFEGLMRARDRQVDASPITLVVEEVAHAPVLNAQAQRVARGEVARDFRGRILPTETAAIFA